MGRFMMEPSLGGTNLKRPDLSVLRAGYFAARNNKGRGAI
jgi:hypothetical protein